MFSKQKLDDFIELREAMAEADRLTKRPTSTPQDRNRFNFLIAKIAVLRSGAASAEDLRWNQVNRAAAEMGMPITVKVPGILTDEQKAESRMWAEFVKTGKVEYRDEGTGNPAASFLQGNMGTFVPLDFFRQYLPVALRQYDPLFDPDIVSYLETEHGRPIQVPNASAIDTVADVVSESAGSSEADYDDAGQVIVGGFTYRTPLWRISMESFQDLDASYIATEMFKRWASQRIALGAGADLAVGNGVGRPLGLVTALIANSGQAVGRTATGSASNTGLSETGANSVGSDDLNALFYSVNPAYRSSPKCAWFMNSNTMAYIASLKDKNGRPLYSLDGPNQTLLGKPVRISPSLDDIGGSKYPIAFGDMSYWLTRCAREQQWIKVYKQAPGLVEKGKVGLRAFVRYDGALLYNDPVAAPPIRLLQNHS